MNINEEVLRILDETLGLHGRSATFSSATPLLGAVPELDSMAVVALITGLEDQLGVTMEDDEIDDETFATVGTLTNFVASKISV